MVMVGVKAARVAGPGFPRKVSVAPLNFHMVRSLQGQAGLMVWENLQLHLVSGVGQELGGFGERTVLHAGAINGEDVVSYMQRPTSVCNTCRFDFVYDDDLFVTAH